MYDDDLKKISSVKEEDVNEGLAYIASMSTCRWASACVEQTCPYPVALPTAHPFGKLLP